MPKVLGNNSNMSEDRSRMAKRNLKLVPLAAACAIAIASIAAFVLIKRPVSITEQFPDEALRNQIEQEVDVDHDGKISEAEAREVTSLVVTEGKVVSGLDVFPALSSLVVRGADVTSVDVSNMQSLSRLDVADSPNLSSLGVSNALNLSVVDLRGTSVDTLDLSGASSLSRVLRNPDVNVAGLDAHPTKRNLMTHFEQRANDPSKSFTVDAEYGEGGLMVKRRITDSVNVTIDYEHDQNGELTSVAVQSDADPRLNNHWILNRASDKTEATGDSGTYVRRSYDNMGRLAGVSLNVEGTSEPIACDMNLAYDARGFLDGIDVVNSDGSVKQYDVESQGNGNITSISTDDGIEYRNPGSVRGMSMKIGADNSLETTVTDGGSSSLIRRNPDGTAIEVTGSYGGFVSQDGKNTHKWGKIAAQDGSSVLKYDIDYVKSDVYAGAAESGASPVSMRDTTNPDFVVDCWLLRDVDSAVQVVVAEVESSQWSLGSTVPILSEADAFKSEKQMKALEAFLPDVTKQLGLGADCRYGFFTCGEEALPMMVVTDSQDAGSAKALCAIVDEKPMVVKLADEGEQLVACGGGFFRTTAKDGSERVLRFNGVSLEQIAEVADGRYANINLGANDREATQEDITSLEKCYPSAMDTIEWKVP